MTLHHSRLGRWGEQAAARWYEYHGYTVVEHNWHCEYGELDLIAVRFDGVRRRRTLAVFIEVKTRSTDRFGSGVEAVDHRKQVRIRRTAAVWLSGQRVHIPDVRFDIVDVDARGHLQVHEAAF